MATAAAEPSATDPAARAGARSCTACSPRSATSTPPSAPSRPAPRPPEQRQCMPTSTTTRRPLGLGGPDPSALEAVYRLQDPRLPGFLLEAMDVGMRDTNSGLECRGIAS